MTRTVGSISTSGETVMIQEQAWIFSQEGDKRGF